MIEFSSLKEMPTALIDLQLNIKNPTRNKKAYNYYYADMDEVLECIKRPCIDHGFSVVQMPYNDEEILGVETLLVHKSGEFIKARFGSKPSKSDPQSVGSHISYYRRYSLLSMFNLSQEDDDGASASGRTNGKPELASDGQKKFLFSLMGMEKYNQNKSFIEKQMTKSQATKKIEEMKGE